VGDAARERAGLRVCPLTELAPVVLGEVHVVAPGRPDVGERLVAFGVGDALHLIEAGVGHPCAE
jgi:hypothetical protein